MLITIWTRMQKKKRRIWYMTGRYTPVLREMRNTCLIMIEE